MKVKIKTWEDMEKEFGLYRNNKINCDARFLPKMEEEMPEDRIIELKSDDVYETGLDWNGWEISEDMIEEWIEKEE